MRPFVIYADSACDIPVEKLNEWGVKVCSLTFTFNDSPRQYENYEMPAPDFYGKMRSGGIAKTSAVNVSTFKALFEEDLKAGNDIFYIGFSSGLSTTVNSAKVAADELLAVYTDGKIVTVDSLAASAGYGLLLYLAVREKENGKSLDEIAKFVLDMRLRICHWFTVDDLVYLKRGGRISPTVALVGNMLGIKPVLHVDNDGHLINMFKVRGRKTSIRELANKFAELHTDSEQTIFISHGDCIEDANFLNQVLTEQYGRSASLIVNVGPVIGAHSGPGTLALFFVTDKNR